jgi:hypothetical protein
MGSEGDSGPGSEEASSRIDSHLHQERESAPGLPVVAEKYRLLREIGRGGFGVVFEAQDLREGRTVALKQILPSRLQETSVHSRLEEEARILAAIRHHGVVRFLDWGMVPEGPFLVTALLQGISMREWIRDRKSMTPQEALPRTVSLTFQLVEALCCAHAFTAHLDIKPENLFLQEDGTAVFLDFGLARITDFRAQGRRLLGTAYYVAPEIIGGREVVGYRADVYSLGVVLYEMFRGELPVGVFAPVRHSLPDAPETLDPVLRRALETDPVRRFRNIFELRAALVSCFPEVRPPDEELSLARRAVAGADPSASLWLATLLESLGQGRQAEEAYKHAAKAGRGTPIEEMAREGLGYPRKRSSRFCILCGTDLPPGSRWSALCLDCRKGRRKQRKAKPPPAGRGEEVLLRGPRGGATILRFSRTGEECLAVGEFGEAVVLREAWKASRRLNTARGTLDASFLGGDGRSILLAGRRGASCGWSKNPLVPLPGTAPPEDPSDLAEGTLSGESLSASEEAVSRHPPHPTACAFLSPDRIWLGDAAGRIREFIIPPGEEVEEKVVLDGRILRIGRLPTGAMIALSAKGEWAIWEEGSLGKPRRQAIPVKPIGAAAVARHVPAFAFVSGGRVYLSHPIASSTPVTFSLRSRVMALALDPQGEKIGLGDEKGGVRILGKGGEGDRRFQLDGNLVTAIDFSPDGSWLGASTLSGGLWMIRL